MWDHDAVRVLSNAYKICPQCGARSIHGSQFCASCGHGLQSTATTEGDPFLGVVLGGKYETLELIGEGAMGRVYKARQITLGKPFAAKILAPHLIHDESSRARFAAEAHNAASLNHPNCVSVVDFGHTEHGAAYIVMEFIAGRTLESLIERDYPLSTTRIVDLVVQVLAALTEAHGLGILHRDLKPENILVQQLRTHGEFAKVLDFGIAKLMEDTAQAGTGLTSQGMVCGTPEYMSPEQARGFKLDQRSDLYSVGVILYQMLAGRPPFESGSAIELLHKHITEEPVPPSQLVGSPPSPLEAVCLRALSKDPSLRYGSAQEFREALIAAAGVVQASLTCDACGSPIRVEHRFCPSCGAATHHGSSQTAPDDPGRSGMNWPKPAEPTAEVVVRNFPLPLAGRDSVMQRAQALLRRPHTGVRVLVISGDPGVGKTRLGDEIAAAAESVGWRAFYTGADPTGARTPLRPIQRIVAHVLGVDAERATTQELGRIANTSGLSFEELPGLTELFQRSGPATELELRVRRRECFASAVQALLHGGNGQPLLLFFDDVDAYDEPSREILRRLGAAIGPEPVLVLCTTSEPSAEWLGGAVERLGPLPRDVLEQVGRRITRDTNPQSELPRALAEMAPLSPLMLETHLRLLALGVQAPSDADETMLLEARLRELSEPARGLIDIASVFGERFVTAKLRRVITGLEQEDDRSMADALLELVGGGVLVSIGVAEHAFVHRLLRTVAYEQISPERRQTLHRLVANVIDDDPRSQPVRAYHLLEAKSFDAVSAVVVAAEAAERAFDDARAARWAEAAFRMLEEDSPPGREPLELRLAQVIARVMRSDEGHARAIQLLERCYDRATEAEHQAKLLCALGDVQVRAELHERAISTLKRALAPAIASGDRPTMMNIYCEIGRINAFQNELGPAIAELEEGLDFFTLGEGPRAIVDFPLWRYLLRLCEYNRAFGDMKRSRQWCDHALWQAERRGDRLGILRTHALMAWVLRDLNQLALAEQHLARALDEARYFGDRLTTAELLIERARARAARGRFSDAKRCCEEALRLAKAIQWTGGIHHAEQTLAMLSRQAESLRRSH